MTPIEQAQETLQKIAAGEMLFGGEADLMRSTLLRCALDAANALLEHDRLSWHPE